jgi:hypothetical protein
MNKTGSSSIQATALASADRLLLDHGVQYYSGLKQHSLIAGLFMDDPVSYAAIARQVGHQRNVVDRWREIEWERLDTTIAQSEAATFVLSGEGLSTMAVTEVERMQAFFSSRFERTEVYLYLRDPFGYATSKAQQNVKSGVTFAEMRHANLDEPMTGPRLADGRFSPAIQPFYRHRIEPFRRWFGASNVHLREFDPSSLAHHDVTSDFFAWALGIDVTAAGLDVLRKNESMDDRAVKLLEAANRIVPLYRGLERNPERARTLVPTLARHDGARFVFPDFDMERFADVVRDDVDWLREATNGAIDFDLSSPPSRPSSRSEPPPPERLAAALNARLLRADKDRRRARTLDLVAAAHDPTTHDLAAVARSLRHELAECGDHGLVERLAPLVEAVLDQPI